MDKIKIAVLAGGLSPERDVSLSSGSKIANALITAGHRAVLIDSYLGLDMPDDLESFFDNEPTYSYSVPEKAPSLEEIIARGGGSRAVFGKNVLTVCRAADIVFIALHGGAGENGMVQAVLEAEQIPHTGSGYEGCLLSMDKQISKSLLTSGGLRTPPGVFIPASTSEDDALAKIKENLVCPLVIKPVACGSSVGVSIVEKPEQLEEAYRTAAAFCTGVLAERFIKGREIQVGVLDGEYLPPIEIITKEGFYDYKNKYDGLTEEITPAPISDSETKEIGEMATLACELLKLSGYARIDFIREDATGIYYVLEANSLPGMTPTSLLPQEAAAAGIDYVMLCNKIVETALGGKK